MKTGNAYRVVTLLKELSVLDLYGDSTALGVTFKLNGTDVFMKNPDFNKFVRERMLEVKKELLDIGVVVTD